MILFWLACQNTSAIVQREDLLIRASLDLRGIRPTFEEVQEGSKSDQVMTEQISQWVDSPQLGRQFANLMSGFWRTEVLELDHTEHQYSVDNHIALLTSLGQEPLYMFRELVDHNLPYFELVTGDWIVNNEVLAQWAPVDYPEDATGWKKVHFTDGRPNAGILVSNGLWWRYNSTEANANRGRANIISKNVLCNDFLERQVIIDRNLNLLDQAAVEDAIQNSPTCVGCHVTLDPLASNFWGFYRHFRFAPTEQFAYHPERELNWMDSTNVSPGYFGQSTSSLAELGVQIANDPQFYSCIVQRSMEQFYQRPIEVKDWSTQQSVLHAFVDSGYLLRELIREIVLEEEYQNNIQIAKSVTPYIYATQLEERTLFRFSTEDLDVLQADLFGMRSIAGGVGEDFANRVVVTPSPTFALVIQRLSEAAAYHVTHDQEAANWVFDFDFQDSQNSEDIHFQEVFEYVMAKSPNEQEILLMRELWQEIFNQSQSTVQAWEVLLTYLFRHPDFVSY